jgi:hypothetical protein
MKLQCANARCPLASVLPRFGVLAKGSQPVTKDVIAMGGEDSRPIHPKMKKTT